MTSLKWGLIGAGDIAKKRIAPALRDLENCELVSVSRSKADQAEAFAREFGAPKWFGDWREQIADADIHAVYIATPVFLHAEQTIAAAEAGKHVLCEKPMGLDTAECDRMMAACEANGVKLGIAYYRRFYPVLERVREILRSGELGTVALAQINAFEYVDMPADSPRHWFLEKARSGGGPMMDFGCHRIEVLTELFGTVSDVSSLVSNAVFNREVEDTALASFQFESGVCGSVTVTHGSLEPRDTLDIYGTKGSIHIPVLNHGEMTIRSGNSERAESHPPHANFHEPLIEEFTDAVLKGREPLVGGSTGRYVQMVLAQVYSE